MARCTLLLICIINAVFADIRISSTLPAYNGTIVKAGDQTILSCRTDSKWFFCLWTSPDGQRQCAIQENEPSQVCKGDERLRLSGSHNSCDLRIDNVSESDWGTWMCLVNDDVNFSTDRRHIGLEVGRAGQVDLTSPSGSAYLPTEVLTITEGDSRDLDCRVRGAHPPPSFTWAGPTAPAAPDGSRVKKYAKEMAGELIGNTGNITVLEQGRNEMTSDGRYVDSISTIRYHAHLNDTNSTISCGVDQIDSFGRILFTATRSLRLVVTAIPAPLPVSSYAQKVGIVSGVLLAALFLILLCVLLTIFMCRREPRRKRSSGGEDKSEYQIKPVWTTKTSKTTQEFRSDSSDYGGFTSIGSRYAIPDSESRYARHEKAAQYETHGVAVYHQERSQRSGSHEEEGSVYCDSDRSKTSDRSFGRDDSSKRSSGSFETERSLAEIESGSVTFHPAPGHTLSHAPSLHETHFGVGGEDSPLTILHPPGILMSLPRPSTVEPFHPNYHPYHHYPSYPSSDPSRKISASRSEGAHSHAGHAPPGSRPASTLGVNLGQESRQPMRLSTPTCPGSLVDSKSTSSVFRCPHDCFLLEEESGEHHSLDNNEDLHQHHQQQQQQELHHVAETIKKTLGKMSQL